MKLYLNFLLSGLLSLLFLPLAQGQILKTDRPVNPSDTTVGFIGSVNASWYLNNRSGFTGTENIYRGMDVALDLDYITQYHSFIMINHFNYKSATNAEPLSTGYTHLRGRFFRLARISPEVFTQFQFDRNRNLPFRQLNGLGVRINMLLKDDIDIHAGVGSMYEYERWLNQAESPVEKSLLKMSSYLVLEWQISDQARLNLINYYQTGFDKSLDSYRNRISGDAFLSLAINQWLRFTTNFSYQYESRPVIDIKNFIFRYSNGLQVRF